VDLNQDGQRDILSGSYSRTGGGVDGMAGLFQVLWGQANGKFKKAAALTGTDGKPLIIPAADRQKLTEKICTRPAAVDWDDDGDLDLVVGNFAGTFYLFTGEGKGKFQPEPKLIKTGDKPLKIQGAHSDPFVVDWDRDGDLDLLSGSSSGGVQWAENTAGKGQTPVLKPFQWLIKPGSSKARGGMISAKDLAGPAGSTRVWVDDLNDDGKLDILVGDTVTVTSLPAGVSKQAYEQKKAAWEKAFQAASQEMRNASQDAEKRQAAYNRYRELYAKRAEFIKQERTGFVWLYLQK